MRWWPFGAKSARTETKAILGTTDELGAFLILGDDSQGFSAASAKRLYEQSTAISVPINYIADAIVQIDYAIQDRTTRELILDHEILDFLERPSPMYSRNLFLSCVAHDYLITGEMCVVYLGGINRPPISMQPIGPEKLTAVRAAASDAPGTWIVSGIEMAGSYSADLNSMRVRYLDGTMRELQVVRNYSPRDNSMLRGRSLLVSASKEARQSILGSEHNVSLLRRGGRLSLVFHFSADMTRDDFQKAVDSINKKFGGASQAGQISVTKGGDLKIEEFGKTPQDMDYVNLAKLVEKCLAKQYRFPLPLVSDERMTQNNYQSALLSLYDHCVIPFASVIAGGLSEVLMPRWKMDPRRFRLIPNPDSVTALVMRRNQELAKRKEIGIETDNELRALIGREQYEGGDVIYKPATMVPVGTDLFTDDNERDLLESTLGGAE